MEEIYISKQPLKQQAMTTKSHRTLSQFQFLRRQKTNPNMTKCADLCKQVDQLDQQLSIIQTQRNKALNSNDKVCQNNYTKSTKQFNLKGKVWCLQHVKTQVSYCKDDDSKTINQSYYGGTTLNNAQKIELRNSNTSQYSPLIALYTPQQKQKVPFPKSKLGDSSITSLQYDSTLEFEKRSSKVLIFKGKQNRTPLEKNEKLNRAKEQKPRATIYGSQTWTKKGSGPSGSSRNEEIRKLIEQLQANFVRLYGKNSCKRVKFENLFKELSDVSI